MITSIADVPFPVFMTVSMTTVITLAALAVLFYENRELPFLTRLARTVAGTAQLGGQALLAMSGLFILLWVGSRLSILVWSVLQPYAGAL